MKKELFETVKNCIQSYKPEQRAEVRQLLIDYADGLRSGTLDESQARARALKLKSRT